MGLHDLEDEPGGDGKALKGVPPPASRTAIAEAEASQRVDETMPSTPRKVGRVVISSTNPPARLVLAIKKTIGLKRS